MSDADSITRKEAIAEVVRLRSEVDRQCSEVLYWKDQHRRLRETHDRLRAALERLRPLVESSMERELIDAALAGAEQKPQRIGPDVPDNDMVICPACTSQFVAIPVNVQKQLAECSALPAEAAHRISEAHDRAVELLRELVDIEGPQPGHVMWARKVWAFLGIPEPSATSENPDAVYDPVASDGHAGARARQIDDVADDSFREAAEAHAQVRRALVGLWRIVETKDRATADDLRNIARSVITELMNTEVRCDDDPPPPAPAPAPEDKA